ncbi:S8 family serine peptidase [Streptomyces fuscichromogenes]|uniref:S8 family serine peptidase n=1 Tax=Streptomyces fuscichromogenes TaxID=1324013 RepID=UPI0037F1EF5F
MVAGVVLSLSAVVPVGAVPVSGSVSLPTVVSALAEGEGCVGASHRQARVEPWSVGALGLPRVWQFTEGAGVTVAVVDTGVGSSVPALSGRVTAVGDAGHDCVGHGSFVAGLIAAARTAGVGVAGVAPQVRVLAVRGTDERGVASAGLVADGIRSAVEGGAGVVYVGAALARRSGALTDAVAFAARHDVLVVAPAVPDSLPLPAGGAGAAPAVKPYYPAFTATVLSVEDYGADGARPSAAPDVFAADLAAPGDAVVSVGPRGDGYYVGSGASFAAAMVAGTAALVRAYHPRMTSSEVSRQITATGYPGAVPLLDPYAAVSAVPGGTRAARAPAEPARMAGPAPAGPLYRAVVVAAVGALVVLLVAAIAVVGPRGRARGWRPADGAPGPPRTSADTAENTSGPDIVRSPTTNGRHTEDAA